ncbi:DUF4245 domain-containing protein [Aeromicrobium wangtongii]|nr:DUF4245 domain-containing protein [Aeromicrobium wangtongii]MCL3817930.1 DUF4245 domain-containing protein [Aeromicrobium wangtongii]
MVVIAVILLGLYGVGQLFTNDDKVEAETVDYASVVAQARPAATFPLAAPSELPKGWRATSARFQTNGWHLGVLTGSGDYVGLEQLRASVDRSVDKFADGSKPAGTAEVAGQTWTVRSGPKGRWTYVRSEDGLTTLVNTTASRAVLERYIASLSTS